MTVIDALAQNQTTGRIVGIVKDHTGAVIAGAEVRVVSRATGDERKVTTDEQGNYTVPLLPPGIYQVIIRAKGFQVTYEKVKIFITETTSVKEAVLKISGVDESVTINTAPFIQSTGPQQGRVVDSRMVSELPLATRNFTQILGLSPGTTLDLPDNTGLGQNSQNASVNGARSTQNNFQINGVSALSIATNNAVTGGSLAVPAPEAIQEFKVQTSLYDATFGHSAGGNIQILTKAGTNRFRGGAYEYFRNTVLNANNPFLKAAGVERPILNRNVFGGTLGGPIQQEKSFFFVSYQGTRELNGSSSNGLSSSVLIFDSCQTPPCLTDDRSEESLRRAFHLSSINPIALKLLNVKLANGGFLIPTPQANNQYSGTSPSRFQEDQFNTNTDYRFNEDNRLAVKFFFSNSSPTFAIAPNGGNVPGFPMNQPQKNRLASLQDVHIFNPRLINEASIGYNFIHQQNFTLMPLDDSDVGIQRTNDKEFPGLSQIRIKPNAGGVVFGSPQFPDARTLVASLTAADTISITKGTHSIRTGGEVIYYQHNFTLNQNSRGGINFETFRDFLTGTTSGSVLGTGISERSLRNTDYAIFIQDDWKVAPKLTFNLGLRYELNLPPYDTRGRLTTFDPALYKPRLQVDRSGNPVGPPVGGFVQADNAIPQYDLPELPKVSKRVVEIDANDFAPRLGFAYAPLDSGRLAVRGGYGIFYSRFSNLYLTQSAQVAPFYVTSRRTCLSDCTLTFASPFDDVPSLDQFPMFGPGINLANWVFARNLRTPYLHQYNTSVQYALRTNLLFEVAYVGTRGRHLFRVVGINQARLASPEHPVVNEVTGSAITINTPKNAPLRAPFQGIEIRAPSGLNQTTGESSYDSLQVGLTKRLSHGLQFLGAYTYAKSIDNTASGSGSGQANEVANIAGNQLDDRANRGVSNFDRTHRFVVSYLWDLPRPAFAARLRSGRWLLSDWQVSGIIVAMSGLPIDILDLRAGSFYGLNDGNNALARPNWAPGANRTSAMRNVPPGYYFNPFAFVRPYVQTGQVIPSSNGTAIADATGTDVGDVGRNVLRGPKQTNVDFSVIRRIRINEAKNIEFRAEFFNLFNHVNYANPISNFNAATTINTSTGRIFNDPGTFGQITATSNNPRLIQFALKLNY